MSRRWRVVLAVVGLLLVCLSLAALVYALAPVDRTREQYRPQPTLFAPPQSSLAPVPGSSPIGSRPDTGGEPADWQGRVVWWPEVVA